MIQNKQGGEIPARGIHTDDARRARLAWWRQEAGAVLNSLTPSGLDPQQLGGNIENLVGGVELPVGLAGPLLFRGQAAKGLITAPLATTEGALVASTSRGALAITRSGGVETIVLSQRMNRVPGFEFESVGAAARFAAWIVGQRAALEGQIRAVSRHSRLVELEPIQIGRVIHLRFGYETADASGQNMTTAATSRAVQWINDELALMPGLRPSWVMLETTLSGDKRLSHMNVIAGRGSRVTAECRLDRDVVRSVLKTTPEAIARSYRIGALGGLHAGTIGFDVNAVNAVAAMFVATGQDVACVHESGSAIFSVEATDEGLEAMILMPNLVVGTVGGGTALPQQQDYLVGLGCAGTGGVQRLAEIICGFALALDLSTLAAIASGQFADAHERLGRPNRVNWLSRADLDKPLLEPLMAAALGQPDLEITQLTSEDHVGGTSIITDMAARGERRKLIGLFPLDVTYTRGGQDPKELELIAKIKPLDEEVIIEGAKLASLAGGRVAELYPRWRNWTGFKDIHTREVAIYSCPDPALRSVLPEVYGVLEDPRREAYGVVMERLGREVILMDSADRPDLWQTEHVQAAIHGIAQVHGAWLGRTESWIGQVQSAQRMTAMQELWEALVTHNAAEHPHWISADDGARLLRMVAEIPDWWQELEAMPWSLVHGDFNPRNIALRANGLRLVAYDWELATLHTPQRDLVELLSYVLPVDVDEADVNELVEFHREAVGCASGDSQDADRWRRGYQLALWDFAVSRVQMYLLAHTHRELPFLQKVVPTLLRLIAIEDGR